MRNIGVAGVRVWAKGWRGGRTIAGPRLRRCEEGRGDGQQGTT